MIQKKNTTQSLNDLLDVNAPSPQEGQTLTFVNGEWVNENVALPVTSLDELTDVTAANPQNNQVLTFNDVEGVWEPKTPIIPEPSETNTLDLIDKGSRKPTVCFIFDDTNKYLHDTLLPMFTSRNIGFTTALRQDFIGAAGGGLTWDMVKTIQSSGCEIAFHGMHHNYSGEQQYIDENDVPTYLANCEANGIEIDGWVGPNGDYHTNLIWNLSFPTFKWARGGGANGVANVGSGKDYIKKVDANFIDDLTSTSALDTLKTKIDAFATRGTGVLIISNHFAASNEPYMPLLLDYILSKGIEIKPVNRTYEIYGGIIEYYDSNFVMGGDMANRQDGNGADTYNAARPHFILQKDGNVLSNSAMFRLVHPLGFTVTTPPSSYLLGTSVVQYGTGDNSGGLGQGTMYTYNFGKNPSQTFQIWKGYNSTGLGYRDSDTSGNWKTTTMDKIGIYRAKPSTPTSPGQTGDFSADANYLYICYGTNTWIRVAKDSTWV